MHEHQRKQPVSATSVRSSYFNALYADQFHVQHAMQFLCAAASSVTYVTLECCVCAATLCAVVASRSHSEQSCSTHCTIAGLSALKRERLTSAGTVALNSALLRCNKQQQQIAQNVMRKEEQLMYKRRDQQCLQESMPGLKTLSHPVQEGQYATTRWGSG